MPAKPRPNPKTQEIRYRVFRLPPETRKGMTKRRKALGATVGEFIAAAIGNELPRLLKDLTALNLPGQPDDNWRPARLPLNEILLKVLRKAAEETGMPANRLLLTCLNRAAQRKKRYPAKKKS